MCSHVEESFALESVLCLSYYPKVKTRLPLCSRQLIAMAAKRPNVSYASSNPWQNLLPT